MRSKRLAFVVGGLLLFSAALVHLHRRGARTESGHISTNRSFASVAGTEGQPRAQMLAFQATNEALRRMSTNNTAFQEWGRDFMLKVANDHLSKVPLFALKKAPLKPEDVIVTTLLTTSGAEFDLCTTDRKHALYYENGVLRKAVAHEAEMASIFYEPAKLDRWSQNVGPWSSDQAKQAAEALVRIKGLDPVRMGGRSKPCVRPSTLNLPMPDGSVKPVTVFYTVNWLDATIEDADVLEIQFRRTESGAWEPTVWFDGSTGTGDTESTSFTNLYRRFFAGEKSVSPH